MTYIAKPRLHHPKLPTNALGLTHRDYEGSVSTLCAGCGHDSISGAIIQACFELSLPPHRVAKLSGIGCSSKTPTYFLGASHGFNSVHGRMPSVLTGANLANRELIYMGVSGDGDSASIGLGQFAHCIRRGVNMVYIVENNGVYGLTKGQFSATADKGSKSKKGVGNQDSPIDMVSLALLLGRQGAARAADQGGDRAPRRRLHRLHLALRRLQQSPRFNEELRLRPGPQRGGKLPRRDRGPRRDHARPGAGHGRARASARRLVPETEEARAGLRPHEQDRGDELPPGASPRRRDRHRPALCRPAGAGSARPPRDGRASAQRARRGGALPRECCARKGERVVEVRGGFSYAACPNIQPSHCRTSGIRGASGRRPFATSIIPQSPRAASNRSSPALSSPKPPCTMSAIFGLKRTPLLSAHFRTARDCEARSSCRR